MTDIRKEFRYDYQSAPEAHAAQTGFHPGLLLGYENLKPEGMSELGRGFLRYVGCVSTIALAALVVIFVMWLAIDHPGVALFADGSFGLGDAPYKITGCLPWGLCR